MTGPAAAKTPAVALDRVPASKRVEGQGTHDKPPVASASRAWPSHPNPGPGGGSSSGHVFGQVRLRREQPASGAYPRIAQANDPAEAEAERAAARVGASDTQGDPSAPIRPGTSAWGPPQGDVRATPAQSSRIAKAAAEARPLPSAERGFYEQRLGHDFGSVRIHTGSDSAAAAASLRAEAFSYGNGIYFGEGRYRPGDAGSRGLMAHELTHAIQARPNVIARRALDGVAADPAPDAEVPSNMGRSDVANAEGQPATATEAEIDGLLGGDPSDSAGGAQRRIAGLHPDKRRQVVTALLAREVESGGEGREGTARTLRARPVPSSASAFASKPAVSPDRMKIEGTSDVRARRSAAASAPPFSPAGVRPAISQPQVDPADPQAGAAAAVVGEAKPSIVPRAVPNLAHRPPAVRGPGTSPTNEAPRTPGRGPVQQGPVGGAGKSAQLAEEKPTANTGGSAEETASVDDDRPLRLADLFQEDERRPEAARPRSENANALAPDGDIAPATDEISPPGAALGERSDETGSQMEALAGQLESALASIRENLDAQAATVKGRVRQRAGAARAGIRAEVSGAVQKIQAGKAQLLSDLAGTVTATHGAIDASLAIRRGEASVAGITSQQTIRGIFSGHRTSVATTVKSNVDAAEKLRGDKAEIARKRNRADIRTAYVKAGAKMRTYPGTNRGAFIGNTTFDVAEAVANKMRDQEPEIVSAVGEVTAPLPKYFREQGERALEGFDVNLPEILGSVDKGVAQTQADQAQRRGEAHARLDAVAAQTRVEIEGLALEATAQAAGFGPQVEARLDRELGRVLQTIATAPRQALGKVSGPIEEAIGLFRSGGRVDVQAAGNLTTALSGFLDSSTASVVSAMENAAQASQERFQQMHGGARQAMRAQVERTNQFWASARTGFVTTTGTMIANFDAGFAASVTLLKGTLTSTEQSIRDQLAPVVSQLDGSFKETLRDSEHQIDGRINEGLGKNTEALAELDDKMEEAARDAAYEWDHPVRHAIKTGLEFLAGLIVGIVTILAMVAVLLLVGWAIAAILGVSMLTAGLILLAGMAAFSIGYAFGARLAAGQDIGEAFVGAVGDFAKGVPGMLYDMTGIPKLRRAFSDERLTPYERGKLMGEGGTELVLAIFMVRGAVKGIATGFRNLPRFRPPTSPGAGALPEAAVPRMNVEPIPPKGPVETPAAPRPVAEPAMPRPASSGLPADNVRPIESAQPGFAGRQPQLRTQRPMTTADEFAGRVRAGQGPGPRVNEANRPQMEVQSEPMPKAVGAEDFAPRTMEPPGPPRLRVIEGGAGGRSGASDGPSLDIRASAEGGGGRGAGAGPRPIGGNEGPSPVRGGRPAMEGRVSGEPSGPAGGRPARATPEGASEPAPSGSKPAGRASMEEPVPGEAGSPRSAEAPKQSEPARPAQQEPASRQAETAKAQEEAKPDSPVSAEQSPQERLSSLKKEVEGLRSEHDAKASRLKSLRNRRENSSLRERRAMKEQDAFEQQGKWREAEAAKDRVASERNNKIQADNEAAEVLQEMRDLEVKLGNKAREAELLDLRVNPEQRSEMPCFSADTPVWGVEGSKPISKISAGDKVRSLDLASGMVVVRKVEALLVNKTNHFYDIRVDGDVIQATGRHPFWLPQDGLWIPAGELQAGMQLQHWDGSRRIVEGIACRDIGETPSYNLRISDLHNYFVGPGILVHNQNVANYPFGEHVIYEGTNPNFPGKIYIGRSNDTDIRQGGHRREAIRQLRRTDLTPKEREFWEFKRDMVLKERITGLTEEQAKFFEQKNIDIERAQNPEKLMNRKLVEITKPEMERLERSIANDSRVRDAKFCMK